MRKRSLLEKIQRSFSARVSLLVVFFTAIIFLASQAWSIYESRGGIREETIKFANQVLENSALKLTNILESVEKSSSDLEWLVYRHLDSQDTLLQYSRNVIQSNTYISGCSIAMEPYFFKDQKYFSAYSTRVDGDVETTQEGRDTYQYFYTDWYLMPKLLYQACWTEPYCDWEDDDEPGMQTDRLLSYCKPLTMEDGSFIGVIALDIDINWLSETLSKVKPFRNSYCTLISRGGTYIVHPDQNKLFYETIFTQGLEVPNPDIVEIGRDMQDWRGGNKVVKMDGKRCYVFYNTMRSTGWSLAIVCPEKEIFQEIVNMWRRNILILLLGVVAMFLACHFIIRRATRPLIDLAQGAEQIAAGQFDKLLPSSHREDEIGTLSRSFSHMQKSLVAYIDQLTKTTAKKERIDRELQIAREIQMSMLPTEFPPFPERKDVDLYAFMRPAKEVGGDLYDFFINGEKLYFCIGDVSGKGVPASIFMAVVRSLFRVAGQQGLSPSEIALRINNAVAEENEKLMFITMFIGMVDLGSGVLHFCNCGHNPPLLLPMDEKSKPQFLSCEANTVIGVIHDFPFKGQTLQHFRGTPLLLFTDGLNEAENKKHQEFGNRKIVDTVDKPFVDATKTVKDLLKANAKHVGDGEPSDDLTMMCLLVKK